MVNTIVKQGQLLSDEDTKLEFAQASLLKILSWLQISQEQNRQATKIFSDLDKERKGYLEEQQFVEGMTQLPGGRIRMNSNAWKRTFRRTDVNKDGRIDY